jgi:hypothetical protein
MIIDGDAARLRVLFIRARDRLRWCIDDGAILC